MKTKLISLLLLSTIFVSSCSHGKKEKIADGYDKYNYSDAVLDVDHFTYTGNFKKPELKIDGKDDDAEWSGPSVSETLFFNNEDNDISVKMLRGENNLFFFFKVLDKQICSKGNNNGDDVSFSDSVEIYIDGLNDGGDFPKKDDYQINLGVNDKTRILVGNGKEWSQWNGLCQYEVLIDGTLNNNNDTDVGYTVEVMLPWSQINRSKDSVIGVAFGNVDKDTLNEKEETKWNGLTFNGVLAEPQKPDNFITYDINSFRSRGESPSLISISGKVNDSANEPLSDVKVAFGSQSVITDSNGNYIINNVHSNEDFTLSFEKSGFKTYQKTVKKAALLSNGDEVFALNVNLESGSGTKVDELNYVEIGYTEEKMVLGHEFISKFVSVSRHDEFGVSIKVESDISFDTNEKMELYVDTGDLTRESTDGKTFAIIVEKNKLLSFASNPKKIATQYSLNFIQCEFESRLLTIYIPYKVIKTNKASTLGFAFGLWCELVKDWAPLMNNFEPTDPELPTSYVSVNANGEVSK